MERAPSLIGGSTFISDLAEAILKSLNQVQALIGMYLPQESISNHDLQLILKARLGMKSWIIFFDLLRHTPKTSSCLSCSLFLKVLIETVRVLKTFEESWGGLHQASTLLHYGELSLDEHSYWSLVHLEKTHYDSDCGGSILPTSCQPR